MNMNEKRCKNLEVVGEGIMIGKHGACHVPICKKTDKLCNNCKKTILDFCLWLRDQGLAYETIYYGSYKDIEELIDRYLKEEKGSE